VRLQQQLLLVVCHLVLCYPHQTPHSSKLQQLQQ
jgi:hypothetical protein